MERDTGNDDPAQEAVAVSDEDPSIDLPGSSITYRIALGPQQGCKVMTLQPCSIVELTSLQPELVM